MNDDWSFRIFEKSTGQGCKGNRKNNKKMKQFSLGEEEKKNCTCKNLNKNIEDYSLEKEERKKKKRKQKKNTCDEF